MSRALPVLFLLAATACGDDDERPSAPEPAAEVEPEPSPAEPAPEAAPEGRRELEERAPPADLAKVRQYRRALSEAREAHRAENDERAIERYRAALALDPNGRALCELGWVQLLAGQEEEARDSLERGLALLPAHDPVPERFVGPVGACLYNLGRLEEELHHVEAARRRYRRSLEVRPGNAAVGRRLAALPPEPEPEPAGDPLPDCPARGRVVDLEAWQRRVRGIEGPSIRYRELLEELGMTGISDAQFEDIMGFDEADEPPTLSASVEILELDLGERAGRAVHASFVDEHDNSADRVAVLIAQDGGAYCLAGVIDYDQDMCSTSCLGDDTALTLTTVQLLGDGIDSLRAVTTSGGCSCGSERGAVSTTSFDSVRGDRLVHHLELTTAEAWYTSPVPPSSWTSASIEIVGEGFPRQLRVTTRVECEPGCTTRALDEAQDAIDAAEDEETRRELEWELESSCGYSPEPCEPSEATEVYVLRGDAYVVR